MSARAFPLNYPDAATFPGEIQATKKKKQKKKNKFLIFFHFILFSL